MDTNLRDALRGLAPDARGADVAHVVAQLLRAGQLYEHGLDVKILGLPGLADKAPEGPDGGLRARAMESWQEAVARVAKAEPLRCHPWKTLVRAHAPTVLEQPKYGDWWALIRARPGQDGRSKWFHATADRWALTPCTDRGAAFWSQNWTLLFTAEELLEYLEARCVAWRTRPERGARRRRR